MEARCAHSTVDPSLAVCFSFEPSEKDLAYYGLIVQAVFCCLCGSSACYVPMGDLRYVHGMIDGVFAATTCAEIAFSACVSRLCATWTDSCLAHDETVTMYSTQKKTKSLTQTMRSAATYACACDDDDACACFLSVLD